MKNKIFKTNAILLNYSTLMTHTIQRSTLTYNDIEI